MGVVNTCAADTGDANGRNCGVEVAEHAESIDAEGDRERSSTNDGVSLNNAGLMSSRVGIRDIALPNG